MFNRNSYSIKYDIPQYHSNHLNNVNHARIKATFQIGDWKFGVEIVIDEMDDEIKNIRRYTFRNKNVIMSVNGS